MQKCFLGLDVGTQGARLVLVNQHGNLIASEAKNFILDDRFREEQSPEIWWETSKYLLEELLKNLPDNFNRKSIHAISVTSTSGTVIPLDKNNLPLHPAIMYSNPRSANQGLRCKNIAEQFVFNGYTGFNASSGISKMLWFQEEYPEKAKDIALWIHASDYLIGKLSGKYDITDYTNVLKSGYDLNNLCWPKYIDNELGILMDTLQEVVPSGTAIGVLTQELANLLGIPQIIVVVGMTDGCATQMASGAVNPGDWNTTIGTTLVIKGVTNKNIIDPLGRLYSHRHPEGYWMPGGASNTGADWISLDFKCDLNEINQKAEKYIPTGKLSWPLKQKGERYPIMSPQAIGFYAENISKEELFASNLEGVAFIERLAYENIEELSSEKIKAVYSAGGGSNSDLWMRIRASVLNVPIFKCKEASGAFGAAIMAASKTYYKSLMEAAGQMTQIEKRIDPEPTLQRSYELQYKRFIQKLKELKYL